MRAEVQAFANKVPSGKTFIFSLQMSINIVSLFKHFGRQCFKTALGKAPKRYSQVVDRTTKIMDIRKFPKSIVEYTKRRKTTSKMMTVYILWLLFLTYLFRTDPTRQHHSDVIDIFLITLTMLVALVYFITLIVLVIRNKKNPEKENDYDIAKYIFIIVTILFFYLIPT